METVPSSELVELIQLKNQLVKMTQQGLLAQHDLNAMNRALDLISYSLVDDISDEALPDLVNRLRHDNPQLNITALETIFRKQRFDSLLKLRNQMLEVQVDAQYIDVSTLLPGYNKIPVDLFNWSLKKRQYQQILDEMVARPEDSKVLFDKIHAFFGPKQSNILPSSPQLIGLPEFSSNMVRHLYLAKQISNEQAMDFNQDEENLRTQLRDAENLIRQQFNQGMISAQHEYHGEKELYHLLIKESVSPRSEITLAELILLWEGPNLAYLVQELVDKNQLTQHACELFLTRTGIDPLTDKNELNDWIQNNQEQDNQKHQQLMMLIEQNRLLYDVVQIISLSHLSQTPELHRQRWLPIALSLMEKQQAEEVENTLDNQSILTEEKSTTISSMQVEKQTVESTNKNSKEEPWQTITTDILQQDNSLPESDDIASLHAPRKEPQHQDLLVEQHSNWNQYIKPFLSENWLGLIGICFIIAAWPILSMLVWDKSEYYRIAAGAIPLLFLTVGSAWICQFFSQLKTNESQINSSDGLSISANRKPVQLFSCLTTWTLPFNILMAVSIYDSGLTLTAGFMLLVYAITIWMISPWLTKATTLSPRTYLLTSHGILALPAVFNSFLPVETSIALMTYVTFIFYAKTLLKNSLIKQKENNSFLFLLVSGHIALGLIANHIFYGQLPAIGTVAVILEMSALYWLYMSGSMKTSMTTDKQTTIMIFAGAATVFGNLLALSTPIYLIITLLLSALFWAGLAHSLRALRPKKWPFEILAVHCIAYVAAIQYQLELTELFFYGLVLASGFAIWLIESKFAKHEIKLLSFAIPISLLFISLAYSMSDFNPLAGISVMLFLAVLNYRRCSQLCQIGFWYVAIALITLLPIIHFYTVSSPSEIALYASIAAIIWALLSPKLKDIPAQLHRTTVLWVICTLTTACLFYVAFEIKFDWNLTWFAALALTLFANLLAAKRAQSLLPLYLSAALVGLASFWIKHEFELVSKSGLGSAMLALLLVVIAPRLQRISFFNRNEKPERFFSRIFVLHSKQYLRLSLEQLGWFLIAVSFFKTIALFAPTLDNFKLSLASSFHIATLIILALRYQRSWIMALSFLPATSLVCALTLSLPLSYAPLLLLALLISLFFIVQWSQNLITPKAIIHSPLQYAHLSLSLLFIPAGILSYGLLLLTDASIWQHLVFGIMSLFYVERVFVTQNNTRFSHLNIIHIIILWSLFFGLSFSAEINQLSLSIIAWYLLGMMMILFIPAYIMRWFNHQFTTIYHLSIQQWLPAMAVILIVLLITSFAQKFELSGATLSLSLIAFHCANRAYHHWLLFLFKWIASVLLGYFFIPNIFYALLLGCFIFYTTEYIWHHFSKFKLFEIQGIGDLNNTPTQLIAKIGVFGIVAVMVIHLANFIGINSTDINSAGSNSTGINSTAINSYWLYSLLPVCLVLYNILKWEILSYAFALLFTYCNIFVILEWQFNVQAWGLGSIHLLTAAIIISVLCLAAAIKLTPGASIKTSQEATS